MSGRKPRGWVQLPCVICGDPEGGRTRGSKIPMRRSLSRFGLEGAACIRCFGRLRGREMRGHPLEPERIARRPAKPKVRVERVLTKSGWLPCVICGDPGGGIPKRCVTPARIVLKRYGVDGLGCLRCSVRLRHRLQRGISADPFEVLRGARRTADFRSVSSDSRLLAGSAVRTVPGRS
jgi:hypothetical protein